ncbi:MAG: LamG domain-containing protein [Hamadaea sp.]|nr:LamG domain-containing protein [Hamadaea sp.]
MHRIPKFRPCVGAVATVAVISLAGIGDVGPAMAEPPGGLSVQVTQPVGSGSERSAAQSRAATSGQRVEIVGERSESGQVFANPDGTFTAEMSIMPVRVRQGGDWVPVDTTLAARPDGTVAPKATSLTIAFSGGGSAPLVRLGTGGKEFALSWPGRLPMPRLDGNTAVYPEVLAGVDLRMQATAQGFTQVLVVKTRRAAANPALATLRLALSATGLTMTADEAGNLKATDSSGAVVFRAPTAMMWDSTPRRAAVTEEVPGPDHPGARRASSRVSVADGRLEIRPDQKLLTDPATTYPVFIDPSFSGGATGWTLVLEGVTQPKWNGANDTTPILGKSGYSDWESPAVKYRTYFQFNTAQALGTVLKSAQFRVEEVYAPSCSDRPVSAYGTAPIDQNTNWANQPSQQWAVWIGAKNEALGYSSACPAAFLEWNATGAVAESMRRGLGTTTIMLRADDEGDSYAWKKWLVNADSPKLTVVYNRLPDRPYSVTAEYKPCASTANTTYLNPLNPSDQPAGPTLRAQIKDPDADQVRARFQWSLAADGSRAGSADSAPAASGSFFGVQIPSGTFNDGETFKYRVAGLDPTDIGPWTAYCYATIDRTRPPAPAAVRSGTYPENNIGGAAGYAGGFTFSAPVGSDVAGFRFGLNDQPTQFVPANQVGGTASALVTPLENGPQTLYVYSVDRANNLSGTRYEYHFVAGRGTPPKAHWALDGLDETQVTDMRPQRHDGTITYGPARWVTGRQGDALHLEGGSAAYVNTGGGQVVRTDTSFSVAAWVRIDQDNTAKPVVISQDGSQASAFTLQYAGDVKKWAFTMAQSDAANVLFDRVLSDAAAKIGVWTHLVATYDPSDGQMRLYVNGVLQAGVGKHVNRWNYATGTVQIGRSKYNGAYTGYWKGSIDDAQLYDRIITALEVHDLVSAPTEEQFLPLDEGAGTTAVDISGNLRSVQLGTGASWTSGADVIGRGTAVGLNGTSNGVVTAGRPVVRTDQSFMVSAQVKLDAAAATGTGTVTALSQDGPLSSGFTLGYNRATKGWTFGLSAADAASPTRISVDSSAVGRLATPGVWTHLIGVYDAADGEVTLYVDGEPAGIANGRSTADVAGGMVLGRAKLNGQAAGFWIGAIDDVHLWSGADPNEALSTWYLPVTRRPSAYDGQLNRFLTIDQTSSDHISVPGRAAAAYHFEASLGAFAPADEPNTRMMYRCRLGVDEFTSPSADCEGQEVLGPLGLLYNDPPPADQQVFPVYRCKVAYTTYTDHFDSGDPNCEGKTNEGLLGYTLAYRNLVRYNSPAHPYDHTSSTTRVGPDYRPEFSLGRLAMQGGTDRTALWACLAGEDSFVSTDAACEGQTAVRRLGFVWTAPPPDLSSRELLRCRASWGDLFDSTNPGCEGQTFVKSLGYVVTGL